MRRQNCSRCQWAEVQGSGVNKERLWERSEFDDRRECPKVKTGRVFAHRLRRHRDRARSSSEAIRRCCLACVQHAGAAKSESFRRVAYAEPGLSGWTPGSIRLGTCPTSNVSTIVPVRWRYRNAVGLFKDLVSSVSGGASPGAFAAQHAANRT